MTELYLIRHAEAEGNVYRRIHGQYDGILTPMGLRQVAALEQRLAATRFDACYSSDLTRARQTSQAVCRPRHMNVRLRPGLREVQLGRWENQPFGQLDNFEPERIEQFYHDPLVWRVEGGETYGDYAGRMVQTLEEIARANDGKTVAAFSHSCAIRGALMRLFFHDDPAAYPFCDNTAVSLLRYDGGKFEAVYLNDNSHLTGALSTLARQKWWKNRPRADFNLWFRPAQGNFELLLTLYRQAWAALYDSDRDFDAEAVLRLAAQQAQLDGQRVVYAMRRDEPVGVVLLRDCKAPDALWITFLAMTEPYRGLGMGPQLLGHAVSLARQAGRSRVCLSVSPRNERALAFYTRYGFRPGGSAPGLREPLQVLTLDVDPRHADVPPAEEEVFSGVDIS